MRLVEPAYYRPGTHGSIFRQLMAQMISSPAVVLGGAGLPLFGGQPFDLITFPEAFAPASALVDVLRSAPQAGELGCVHVGLRPDESDGHLFKVSEIRSLVGEVKAMAGLVVQDLAAFELWLAEQNEGHRYNIGCFFAVDADGRLRVCFHPKLVRAKVEHSASPEQHMAEGRLLSLVTLLPIDKRYKTLTIQPLICSDLLDLETDQKTLPPIPAVSSGDCTTLDPPDHVDLVSVVTCTPQPATPGSDCEKPVREWHDEFRQSFCRAAKSPGQSRHHFASFVMANFNMLGAKAGGLSGLFQPIGPKIEPPASDIELCYYGREEQGQNRWFPPGGVIFDERHEWRAYIAQLKPVDADKPADSDPTAVRVFEFVLPSMLRDGSPWDGNTGISLCEVLAGRWAGGTTNLTFGCAEPIL